MWKSCNRRKTMNLLSLAYNVTHAFGGEKRRVSGLTLFQMPLRHWDHLEEGSRVSLRICGSLTHIEFWSRIPGLGDWKRIGAPRQHEIKLLKEDIAREADDLVQNIFLNLWREQPHMMRNIRKHLEQADINCSPPLPNT